VQYKTEGLGRGQIDTEERLQELEKSLLDSTFRGEL
jgi:hypothetical protein